MWNPIYLIIAFAVLAASVASYLPDHIRAMDMPHERKIVKLAPCEPWCGDPVAKYIHSAGYYEYLSREE